MNSRKESKDKKDSTLRKNVDNDNTKRSGKTESNHKTDYISKNEVDNNTMKH